MTLFTPKPVVTVHDHWRRVAECSRKRGFRSKKWANARKDELEAKDGSPMKVYECRWCGLLHVAHAGTNAKRR